MQLLLVLRVLGWLLGYRKLAIVPRQVLACWWRYLIQAIEYSLAQPIVILLVRLRLFWREVIVCELETVSPAAVCVTLVWLDVKGINVLSVCGVLSGIRGAAEVRERVGYSHGRSNRSKKLTQICFQREPPQTESNISDR